MTNILLVMRKGYRIHGDHIETLLRLGLTIHLYSDVAGAAGDPRFAAVLTTAQATTVEQVVAYCRVHDIARAITFQETDIEIAAAINQALGARGCSAEAAAIARDKSRQRRFLAAHGLPSPEFIEVASVEAGCLAAARIGYPLIVKPTRAASSMHVALVANQDELAARLAAIEEISRKQVGNYYTGDQSGAFALLEEFLPGDEVTLDGVIIDGTLHLGGIHNKMRMQGPFFEEDLYSLPFKRPADEGSLLAIAAGICAALGLENSLFNVELRADRCGAYRVVEFSPRISGGHVYRNIRDVYTIDLVAAHVSACIDGLAGLRDHALRRSAPRMATCIKFVYRSGRVVENHAGPAMLASVFTAYYPLASAGSVVNAAPRGFDIAGLLSVKGPYRDLADIEAIERHAGELESELALAVVDEAA